MHIHVCLTGSQQYQASCTSCQPAASLTASHPPSSKGVWQLKRHPPLSQLGLDIMTSQQGLHLLTILPAFGHCTANKQHRNIGTHPVRLCTGAQVCPPLSSCPSGPQWGQLTCKQGWLFACKLTTGGVLPGQCALAFHPNSLAPGAPHPPHTHPTHTGQPTCAHLRQHVVLQQLGQVCGSSLAQGLGKGDDGAGHRQYSTTGEFLVLGFR